ncbi:hypothetical protein CBS101457_004721 [Exobasidium rhododendri]|nr:hypothetical protein CBS101457_004721 [Exobasidium rhododendri]
MSLAELQRSTPAKGRREGMEGCDLDRLSQEQLEGLAWKAMEEEERLKERVRRKSTRRSREPISLEDPMKHVTVRRKSNSPRKMAEVEVLIPLPKADTTGMTVRHTYDRQASPTRSAMKRPHARKSVAFGVVAEFEISRDGDEVCEGSTAIRASQDTAAEAGIESGSTLEASSDVRSSSPLARFDATSSASFLPLVKERKGPVLTRRSSLRSAAAASSNKENEGIKKKAQAAPITRKTSSKSSPKSPMARTRLQSTIQESSVKARVKAREIAARARTTAKAEVEIPKGFRLSSTGTLIPQIKCQPFHTASAPLSSSRSRTRRLSSDADSTTHVKANPVPAWLKRRKNALLKVEEEQLAKELDRVRAEELGQNVGQSSTIVQKRAGSAKAASTQKSAYTSAVEKRIAERAAWEVKRKLKEDLLQQEKERARQERAQREEEDYRQARMKSIPRANPVPEWIRLRTAKR